VNDTTRFAGGGVDFKGKLIGAEDVVEPRGDKMCQIAMAKLKAGVKASREHKLRIVVNISLDGIKIVDDKSSVSDKIFVIFSASLANSITFDSVVTITYYAALSRGLIKLCTPSVRPSVSLTRAFSLLETGES